MSRAERFEGLVYVAQRGLVSLFDPEVHQGEETLTQVLVFFDREPDEDPLPPGLMKAREQRLAARGPVREWYLVTEHGDHTEESEELRGDFGFLVVSVGSVDTAERVLKTALERSM